MASPSARDAESAIADALRQVAQGLLRVEEALRLQEQEAERRLQEALRLQEQRAAAAVREAVRGMEQQLQERDETIGALRHSLDEQVQRAETRVAAMEQRMGWSWAKEGSDAGGQTTLELLEGRMEKLEEAFHKALAWFVPRVDTLLTYLEKGSPRETAHALLSAASSSSTSVSPPSDFPFASTSAASGLSATEEEAWNRVKLRFREAKARWDSARLAPCPLGEDLCRAAHEGRLEDVRWLLDRGADVNYPCSDGGTPLTSAFYFSSGVSDGNPAIVSLLLESGADVNAVTVLGCSVLHWAAGRDSSCRCLAEFIAAGADVNARNKDGTTPLHWAAVNDNEQAVRALLEAGARKDLRGWDGRWKDKTPFLFAKSLTIQNLLRP